jgi:hypothetical protein
MSKALDAAQVTWSDTYRAEIITVLANKLPSDLLPKALAVAQSIQDNSDKAKALTALVDRVPNLLSQALEVAQEIQNEDICTEALIALMNRLPPHLLSKAIKAVQALQYDYNRARVLAALADRFPEMLPQAFAAAQAILYEPRRAQAVTAFVNKLPEALPNALKTVQAFQNDTERAEALAPLALHLADHPNNFECWKDLLRSLSSRTRPSLLSDLAVLIPAAIALGGEVGAAEIARAIQDVSRWWS